jgi:hypothetical protein
MTTPESVPVSSSNSASSSKRLVRVLVVSVSVFLVLACVGVFFAWQIFVKRSDAGYIRSVTSVLPIPAARVGSRVVLYREFLSSRETLKTFLASPAAKEQGMSVPFDANLERNALEKLLVQRVLEGIAEERHVAVNEEELRQYFSEVLSATSSTTPDVGSYLLQNFGWSEDDFRQNVLKPALLEQKISAALAEEANDDPDALNRMVAQRMERGDVVRYVRF